MRNSRWIYEARLDVDPLRIRRSRDRGGDWKRRVAEAKGKGYEAIVYLNRYEGVPLERIEEASRDGVDLDRLTDREFRKRVPEARDSWIIFDITARSKSWELQNETAPGTGHLEAQPNLSKSVPSGF